MYRLPRPGRCSSGTTPGCLLREVRVLRQLAGRLVPPLAREAWWLCLAADQEPLAHRQQLRLCLKRPQALQPTEHRAGKGQEPEPEQGQVQGQERVKGQGQQPAGKSKIGSSQNFRGQTDFPKRPGGTRLRTPACATGQACIADWAHLLHGIQMKN